MKKLLVVAFIVISSYAFSQVVVQSAPPQSAQTVVIKQKPAFTPHLRLNAYTFYAFDDKVDSYYSSTDYFNGTIKGGFQWGGGLEYMMIPQQGIEISYLRLDSNAPMEYYDGSSIVGKKQTDFDVATNYILIGSNRYFGMNPKIEPYGGLQAGMAIFNVENPDNGNSGNSTKFAWGAKLGLNFWASDKVGIKMQTGLVSAVQSAGGGLYFGTGGAGAGVSTYSTFYQFYVGGGLTFNMSKN
jgi:hypothetical protein